MIRPPVIVSERDDLSVFESVDAAEEKLEAIDVAHGEYQIFDSSGTKLVARVEEATQPFLFGIMRVRRSVVKIGMQDGPMATADPEALKILVIRYLRSVSQRDSGLEGLRLPELVQLLSRTAGLTR